MSLHQPKTFTRTKFGREDVLLDGNRFDACEFGDGTRLIFRGDALPYFNQCLVSDQVEVVLGGHALLTFQFLTVFLEASGDAGAQAVERLLNQYRRRALE